MLSSKLQFKACEYEEDVFQTSSTIWAWTVCVSDIKHVIWTLVRESLWCKNCAFPAVAPLFRVPREEKKKTKPGTLSPYPGTQKLRGLRQVSILVSGLSTVLLKKMLKNTYWKCMPIHSHAFATSIGCRIAMQYTIRDETIKKIESFLWSKCVGVPITTWHTYDVAYLWYVHTNKSCTSIPQYCDWWELARRLWNRLQNATTTHLDSIPDFDELEAWRKLSSAQRAIE